MTVRMRPATTPKHVGLIIRPPPCAFRTGTLRGAGLALPWERNHALPLNPGEPTARSAAAGLPPLAAALGLRPPPCRAGRPCVARSFCRVCLFLERASLKSVPGCQEGYRAAVCSHSISLVRLRRRRRPASKRSVCCLCASFPVCATAPLAFHVQTASASRNKYPVVALLGRGGGHAEHEVPFPLDAIRHFGVVVIDSDRAICGTVTGADDGGCGPEDASWQVGRWVFWIRWHQVIYSARE